MSKHGDILGTTSKNILGGKDYVDSHGVLKGYTMKNGLGGHDYHDSHGDFMGSTMHGVGHDNLNWYRWAYAPLTKFSAL